MLGHRPSKLAKYAAHSGAAHSPLIKSAIRSAIMIVVMFVFAHGIDGITEASHTRKP